MTELAMVSMINHLGAGSVVDRLSSLISHVIFLVIIWTFVALLVLILDRKNGRWVVLTLIIALVINFIVSDGFFLHVVTIFYQRTRPWLAHPDVITPIGPGSELLTNTSFPSRHLSSTLTILTVYFYYYRWSWLPSLIFVFLMAFSRIHNGMHYPSDVLVGALLGVLYATIGLQIIKTFRQKKAVNHHSVERE